jgi:hypothetical protein
LGALPVNRPGVVAQFAADNPNQRAIENAIRRVSAGKNTFL